MNVREATFCAWTRIRSTSVEHIQACVCTCRSVHVQACVCTCRSVHVQACVCTCQSECTRVMHKRVARPRAIWQHGHLNEACSGFRTRLGHSRRHRRAHSLMVCLRAAGRQAACGAGATKRGRCAARARGRRPGAAGAAAAQAHQGHRSGHAAGTCSRRLGGATLPHIVCMPVRVFHILRKLLATWGGHACILRTYVQLPPGPAVCPWSRVVNVWPQSRVVNVWPQSRVVNV